MIAIDKLNRLQNFIEERANDLYVEPDNMKELIESGIESIKGRMRSCSKVLDIGCGQGYALELFTKQGAEPIGITLNEEEHKIVCDKGFDVRIMDMSALEFEKNYFDILWARHSLEHSIFPFFTLAEWYRVLKPGGLLYLEMPAPDTNNNHEFNQNHYSVFGIRMWQSLLTRSGFKILGAFAVDLQTENGNKDLYFRIWAEK